MEKGEPMLQTPPEKESLGEATISRLNQFFQASPASRMLLFESPLI